MCTNRVGDDVVCGQIGWYMWFVYIGLVTMWFVYK